jgi:hypothetical protein
MYVWVCVYRVRMPASAWQQYAQVESVSAWTSNQINNRQICFFIDICSYRKEQLSESQSFAVGLWELTSQGVLVFYKSGGVASTSKGSFNQVTTDVDLYIPLDN